MLRSRAVQLRRSVLTLHKHKQHQHQHLPLPHCATAASSSASSFSSLCSSKIDEETICNLRAIEKKAIWLSAYIVHNANTIRPKRDDMKVGGHMASATSLSTILTALYCDVMGPDDRLAVKPHASPTFHSLQYLLQNQTVEQLQQFRAYGGVQSYPSRTKDKTDVDFSTGSVGLGVVTTTFSSYCQDWLRLKGMAPVQEGPVLGRTIGIVGDAELDEGNVFEALLESAKLDMKNNWWIVDFNRQSLDNVASDKSFRYIDKMFRATGWNVITVKYGKELLKLFAEPVGGRKMKRWVREVDNGLYGSLVFRGGKAFRDQILKDTNNDPDVTALISKFNDDELAKVLSNLGGHCMETMLEAFQTASRTDDRTVFICYTIKGWGLPIQGHRDNHGLYLNTKQVNTLREQHGIPEGDEWAPFSGFDASTEAKVKLALADSSLYSLSTQHEMAKKASEEKKSAIVRRDYSAFAEVHEIPDTFYENKDLKQSTQHGFGSIMLEIGKSKMSYADRVMTMAPDVSTSTQLSGFVNTRGVFGLQESADTAKDLKIMSMNKWNISHQGQHVELGIAENNLFLMLSAAGLTANLFGQRILPIGTLYDPFIARGLDALTYGCYQNSRFMVVSTPSGITLSPEGGAHQSINSPLIGMSQPGLVYMEPSFIDELQVMMSWGLRHMQAPDGGSIYLRLSTRMLEQPSREMTPSLRQDILRGAYYHTELCNATLPSSDTKLCIAFVGAVAPESFTATNELVGRLGMNSVSLLQVTSADALYDDYHNNGDDNSSHIQNLFRDLPRDCAIVTVIDGSPTTLSWLGSVKGHKCRSHGVTQFGQCGDVTDLYKHFDLDAESLVQSALKYMPKNEELN